MALLIAAAISAALACSSPYPRAPDTQRTAVSDTIHGVEFVDPYRWLEDQDSPETRAWIAAQNSYADTIVGYTPLRAEIRDRLLELVDVADFSSPQRAGDHEYFWMRRAGVDQGSIYRRPKPESPTRIDPQQDYEIFLAKQPLPDLFGSGRGSG
jgi:prolyl oligopeptidase